MALRVNRHIRLLLFFLTLLFIDGLPRGADAEPNSPWGVGLFGSNAYLTDGRPSDFKNPGLAVEGNLRVEEHLGVAVRASHHRFLDDNSHLTKVQFLGGYHFFKSESALDLYLESGFGYARLMGHNAFELISIRMGMDYWFSPHWGTSALANLSGDLIIGEGISANGDLSLGVRYRF